MMRCEFGDVVVVRFPFADRQTLRACLARELG